MATTLDMSLDDIIKKSKNNRERARGRGRPWRGREPAGGSLTDGKMAGTVRRGSFRVKAQPSPYTIAKSLRKTKNFPWRPDLFEDSIRAAGLSGLETATKLYISNLDHGVTNEDIRELFADIGKLKRYAVHYDKNGRPSGSAEVVYTRRSDAFAALKRYNNVQLDGKPMKIEVIGSESESELPVSARLNVSGGVNGRRRAVVMTPGMARAGGSVAVNHGSGQRSRGGLRNGGRGGLRNGGRGRGRGQGRGRGRGHSQGQGRGIGKKQPIEKSADQLDKELESYHTEAMHIS